MGRVRQPRALVLVGVCAVIFAGVVLPVRTALAHDELPSPDVSAFGNASASFGSTSSLDLATPVAGMAANTRRPWVLGGGVRRRDLQLR